MPILLKESDLSKRLTKFAAASSGGVDIVSESCWSVSLRIDRLLYDSSKELGNTLLKINLAFYSSRRGWFTRQPSMLIKNLRDSLYQTSHERSA